MKLSTYTTIDEYIANFPDEVQRILQKVRHTIRQVAPEATEKISYGIPTFTLHGKNLVHFAGYDKHIGFYPGAYALEAFAEHITDYETSKGTVKFSLDKPVDYEFIKHITQFCIKQRGQK